MSFLPSPALPTFELPQGLPGLLASFASAFEQTTRLLKVNFAAGSGIPAHALLPHRLTGSEAINEGFRYELEALSSDAHLELKSLIGVPVEVTIVTDAGGDRELCGLVTEAHQEGSDGGFAVYRLVIESGFSVLRKRVNARVFVGLDVREVTRRILSEHLEKNAVLKAAFAFEDRCSAEYPTRPFWMQYNESDLDYLRRIWAREGISFVLQPSAESSPEHPQHTLVLFDDVYDLEANASATARFHRADGTEQADAIQQWNGVRTLQPGSLARMGWDHRAASPITSQETNAVKQGDLAVSLASTLEDYRHHAPTEDESSDHIERLTRQRLQAKEGLAKRFEGQGTVRTFTAGTWFTLAQHPIHDQDEAKDREFLITKLEVEAENNLPKDLQAGLSVFLSSDASKLTPPYRNTFTCIRRGIPVLAEELDPPDPGMIPARVVGPEQSVVHTDDLGRIKVRFLFARGQDHPEAGSSDSDADSAWIRQMETWGSQGFGGSFLPRVGDEVAVEFLGGDPDKPVITGSLHHRTRGTAAFSDASVLPPEKTLSGVRSRMHKGAGGNELLFDDTTHQLRTRLASDHAASHLNLGYLVHPRSGGSGTPRGEGFELRTDAWGAVRAEKGMLITTFRTTGPHLEADPLAGQMESSLQLADALSQTSEPLGAEKLEANDALKTLKDCVQNKKAQGMSGKEVPAFNAPVLGLASPDGILSATPASHVLSAGEHLHLTSGEDTNLGIGKRLAMAIKESWSVFVSKSGIKLFAAKEDFQVQAHEGSIQILADKDAKVTSSNGEIQVLAKKHIKLTAGQCQIEVTEKDVNLYMAGPITIKGNLSFGGVQTGTPMAFASYRPYVEPQQPKDLTDYTLHYYYDDLDETPVRNATFQAKLCDGSVRRGKLDDSGKALLCNVPHGPVDVEYQYDVPEDDDALIKQARDNVRKALDAIVEQTRQDMADEWKEWNEAGWLKRHYLMAANKGQGAAVGAWEWLSGTVESVWQLAVLLYKTDKEIREVRTIILTGQWQRLDQRIAEYRAQGEKIHEAASTVKEMLILFFHDEETRKIIMDFPQKWWGAFPPDEREELTTAFGTQIAIDVVIAVILSAFSAGSAGAAYGSAKWSARIGKLGTKVTKLLDWLEDAFKTLGKLLKRRKRRRLFIKRRPDRKGVVRSKWKAVAVAKALRFPVRTAPNEAFFWSGKTKGIGGEAIARSIAKKNKGTTLELLIEDRDIKMPKWDPADPNVVKAWKDISADYAQGASGKVRAVIGENLRPGNVWETSELPALMSNPNVTEIVTIDPVTGIEKIIFKR